MEKPISNDGTLNNKEVFDFKRLLIKTKISEYKDHLLFQLGLKSYRRFEFIDIKIPDSKLAVLAIEEANDVYDISLLKHCYRTYFFSAGLSISQNLKVDNEHLFITSILHDVGLTNQHNHICSQECFANYGGEFIKQFAITNGVDKLKAESMQLTAAMHLFPYVDRKKNGNEAYLLSKAAAMDVIGTHSFQLPVEFIRKTNFEFSRIDFKENIINTMKTLNHKENTRADILIKMGFSKLAIDNKLDNEVYKS
ncbi:MAG: nitrile hydratase [Pseudooceanicola sp.]|nr:nitrile hydratase [Pseudooceanicola sp.]|tara:strand:- start:175 stop:930 length:756 start_codon:yes stop_codon:yes gene_type:complete